jgi:hypothetical protein
LRVIEGNSPDKRSFCATKPNGGRFIEENAAWSDLLVDYSAALEYERSDFTPRLCDGERKPSL